MTSIAEIGDQAKLLEEYELPIIGEEDFKYYPGPSRMPIASHWSEDGEDEKIVKLVRRQIVRTERGRSGVSKWLKKVLKKLGFGKMK